MIQPTSIPYTITVYDVVTQALNPDGTPKTGKPEPVRKLMQFPQDVIDRIHAMTENVRLRPFVNGWPLTGIDWSWLFVCFETPIPNQVASKLREASGLNMEQWGFHTFDEKRLEGSRDGADPPDVNLMCFSEIAVAARAMKFLGVPELIGDLELQPQKSYFMFAKQDCKHISAIQFCPACPVSAERKGRFDDV